MKLAWVPLPAPGGPKRISLIVVPGIAAKHLSDEMTLPFVIRAVKQRPSAFKVLDSVNAGERRILSHCDGDGVAVPKRAQLFERRGRSGLTCVPHRSQTTRPCG